MRLNDVPANNRPRGTRGGVLTYLEEHDDEVFRMRRCDEIADALSAPKRSVEHALWSLQGRGLISKVSLDGEVWYGSHAAIDALISLRPDAVRL